MKNINKSTERAGGNDSSEGNSNSNENKSQDSKVKGVLGVGEKKSTFLLKNALGNPIGVRAFRPMPKKGNGSKLKTQSSAQLAKRVHKKSIINNPQGLVPMIG